MSTRTLVRDRIAAEFHVLQESEAGRVPTFDVSLRWLSPDETKRASTYCIVVTDETRTSQTLMDDAYELTGALVLYAYDKNDARAKLDLMIEDAIDVLRRAWQSLRGTLQEAMLDTINTSEASTAEDSMPQAVIRWKAVHRRAVMV